MEEKFKVKMPDVDLNFFSSVGPSFDLDIPIKDEKGRFVKGNQLWRNLTVAQLGNKLFFKTPEQMLSDVCDYLDWVTENPLYEEVPVGKEGNLVDVRKMRPPTLEGFAAYKGFSMQIIADYRKKAEYKPVTDFIDSQFFSISFEGAASRLLDGRIIAQKLGLVSRKEVNSNINQRVLLYIPQIEQPKQLGSGEIEDVDFENT